MRRDAGMRGLPWLCGLEQGQGIWRRRALTEVFILYSPWRGGVLLMLITNSKNKRGRKAQLATPQMDQCRERAR